MRGNMNEEVEVSEKTQSDQYFGGVAVGGALLVGTGGMCLLRTVQKPIYEKVQKALGNAPETLQQAVNTFIPAFNNGDTLQMKKSIDDTILAQNRIAT